MSMKYYPDGIDDRVRRIVDLSREFGGNPEYVLAGGGNTSVKYDDHLFVKASGTQLASIDADGFVRMSRSKLDGIWEQRYPEDSALREEAVLSDMMAARSIDGDTRRPSVECLLHNLFPHRYVVHTHPALVNGITCSVESLDAARKILGDDFVWLPVIDPGYILARHVKEAVDEHRARTGRFPRVVLLQNHGIFAAADTEEEIREIYRGVFDRIAAAVTTSPEPSSRILNDEASVQILGAVHEALPGQSAVMFSNSDIDDMIADEESFAELKLSVTPDHIVYCGYRPLFLDDIASAAREIADFIKTEGFSAHIIAIRGQGIIAVHESGKRRDLARQLFLDNVKIAVYARFLRGYPVYARVEYQFHPDLEAEKYRASQAK
jgi:rhamnose utilization protein RhaD (predicted bifunctional aldolase and dehydrogenase)